MLHVYLKKKKKRVSPKALKRSFNAKRVRVCWFIFCFPALHFLTARSDHQQRTWRSSHQYVSDQNWLHVSSSPASKVMRREASITDPPGIVPQRLAWTSAGRHRYLLSTIPGDDYSTTESFRGANSLIIQFELALSREAKYAKQTAKPTVVTSNLIVRLKEMQHSVLSSIHMFPVDRSIAQSSSATQGPVVRAWIQRWLSTFIGIYAGIMNSQRTIN